MNGLGVFLVVLAFYLLVIVVALADHIIRAFSFYTLADRRGIKNAWLSWIPVVNIWITGRLAEDYDARAGIKRRWAVTLIVLSIITSILAMLYFVFVIMITVLSADSSSMDELSVIAVSFFAVIIAWIVIMSLSSIALQTCSIICSYKIFESTVPEKALKYMLIYILVPVAGSICLFKCRNCGYEAACEYVVPVAVPVCNGLNDTETEIRDVTEDE